MTDKQETTGSVPHSEAWHTDGTAAEEGEEDGDGGSLAEEEGGKTTQCTSALNIDLIWAAVEPRVSD